MTVELPRELHSKLVRSAQDERRSLAQQLIVLLERQLSEGDKQLRQFILEAVRSAQGEAPIVSPPPTVPVLVMDGDARIEEERKKEKVGK